jgi:adenosylhomocysteine nucleosidase
MRAAAMGTVPLAAPPAPADVGIVAALPMEVGPLVDSLASVRRYASERHEVVEGTFAGRLVALVVAGPGRSAARRGTHLLLDGHRPRWIVSAGYAGALDPSLRRNDAVLPTEILDPEGRSLAIDMTPPSAGAPGRRITAGRLLTVDAIVRLAGEKADLRRKYGADLVDMESSAVAAACVERGIRFVGVRVISDEAGVDLPPEVLSIMGPTGGYRLGAALAAIWRRPSSLKELLALREHGMEAAYRLAEVLKNIVGGLY